MINTRLKDWSKIVGYHINSHMFRHSGTSITKQVYLHQTDEKKQVLTNFMDVSSELDKYLIVEYKC